MNGMATSEVAIGLYASPYLQFHRGMLLATVAVCVLTALWHVVLRKSYVRLVATSAICIALFSYLTLVLGLVGTVPIAVSRVSLGTQEQVSERDVSDTLRDLHEGTPLRMRGYQEIVDTLQRFAHIESARLGIVEHEPQVVISLIGTASGSYIPTSNRICVNPLVFADGYEGSLEELIELIAHECAHAYEHCVVSGKIPGSYDSPLGTMTPDVAEQWARELSSPDQAYIDWFAYMMQDTEIRARDYAEGAADRYYDAAGIGLVIGDFRAARDVPGYIG
ncbi:MAG: hypothetical protein Q4A07_00430 [Coriobacteriales bacterium]|nr:hypothetical protein [Coriobacteriales bacterium]